MRQRSKFWTFVFSLLPGAGHMYLGLNKIGSSYMITFFLAIFISSLPGLSLFGFLCPLIWFLAFFDCLNKMGLTPDELAAVDDQFFLSQFIPLEGEQADRFMKTKLPYILGGILIFAGCYALVEVFLFGVLGAVINTAIINRIMRYIGTCVVSAVLILAGIWLIRGKRN